MPLAMFFLDPSFPLPHSYFSQSFSPSSKLSFLLSSDLIKASICLQQAPVPPPSPLLLPPAPRALVKVLRRSFAVPSRHVGNRFPDPSIYTVMH
jgi:hypothetical protein